MIRFLLSNIGKHLQIGMLLIRVQNQLTVGGGEFIDEVLGAFPQFKFPSVITIILSINET